MGLLTRSHVRWDVYVVPAWKQLKLRRRKEDTTQLLTEGREETVLFRRFLLIFIFGFAGSLLLCRLFFCCGEWRLLSRFGAWTSHCGGFSCRGPQVLGHAGFVSYDPQA